MKYTDEEIESLLIEYLNSELPSDKKSLVEEWIQSSDENYQKFSRCRHALFLSNVYFAKQNLDEDRALANVHSRIKKRNTARVLRSVYKYMALMLLPLLLLYIFNSKISNPQYLSVRTNPGVCTTLMLPDSTWVTLNSQSELFYPLKFDRNTREVKLVGEAFFEVKKNAKSKFVVNTLYKSQVVVYGTKFNIDAYKDKGKITTTLISGSVKFRYIDDQNRQQECFLKPNQKAEFTENGHTLCVSSTNTEVETAWYKGVMVFMDTPLKDILYIMEKRYNVQFIVRDRRLYNNSFTGSFSSQRVEEVLDIFNLSSNINWRIVSGSKVNDKRVIELY